MFPVRCYTCNTVVAHLYPAYVQRCQSGADVGTTLDELRVTMMCCRRMFITHVDALTTSQMEYPNENRVLDRGGTTLYRRCTTEHTVDCD